LSRCPTSFFGATEEVSPNFEFQIPSAICPVHERGARNERFNILTDIASIVNSAADGTKKRVPVIAVEPQRHGFLAVFATLRNLFLGRVDLVNAFYAVIVARSGFLLLSINAPLTGEPDAHYRNHPRVRIVKTSVL